MKKILVIGDIMLDRYIRGSVLRISPEAPVPVVDVEKYESRLGGAANVAANIATLGGKVDVVGMMGKDRPGIKLLGMLNDLGVRTRGILLADSITTTVKTRVTAQHQHIVRFDNKGTVDTGPAYRHMKSFIESHIKDYSVVVVSDYNKGVVTQGLIDIIKLHISDDAWLIGDPSKDQPQLMSGFNLITPNMVEAAQIAGTSIVTPVDTIAANIIKKLPVHGVLVTMGPDGMYLDSRDGYQWEKKYLKAEAQEVFDVTGAGDTVIATIAYYLAGGSDIREACFMANKAAGIAVGKLETATVTQEDLI